MGYSCRVVLAASHDTASAFRAAAEMYNLVSRLNEEGMTVIMISHDVQEALQRATHILHIGKKTFFGTREEYIVREKAELSVATEEGVFK